MACISLILSEFISRRLPGKCRRRIRSRASGAAGGGCLEGGDVVEYVVMSLRRYVYPPDKEAVICLFEEESTDQTAAQEQSAQDIQVRSRSSVHVRI